jgi:DNA replication protein DnaC
MTWNKIMPGVYECKPGEEKDEELELRLKMSNIPITTLKTHRLATWQHRGSEPWWSAIAQYADGSYNHPFITLLGTVGTGKSHIAFALGWSWLENGKTVLYYQVENLLDALRRGYSSWQGGNPDGYNGILQFTQNVGLLILDDFGAQHETEWAVSKLDQIVDYRYEYKKPLVATTNLALNRLPARIADRLSEGVLIQLTGESFRKQKK